MLIQPSFLIFSNLTYYAHANLVLVFQTNNSEGLDNNLEGLDNHPQVRCLQLADDLVLVIPSGEG